VFHLGAAKSAVVGARNMRARAIAIDAIAIDIVTHI
jgi:hypothetical protein